jgi:hypothetical protein
MRVCVAFSAMNALLRLACVLALSLGLCEILAALGSRSPASDDTDWPIHRPVNLRREFAEIDFARAKPMIAAALDTLSREEMDSGIAPRDGWARLHAYLVDFQRRHPDFVSGRLADDLRVAEIRSH